MDYENFKVAGGKGCVSKVVNSDLQRFHLAPENLSFDSKYIPSWVMAEKTSVVSEQDREILSQIEADFKK